MSAACLLVESMTRMTVGESSAYVSTSTSAPDLQQFNYMQHYNHVQQSAPSFGSPHQSGISARPANLRITIPTEDASQQPAPQLESHVEASVNHNNMQ
eukprot:gene20480-27269_t